MSQSSIALSSDGARWVVVNASPDLRVQLAAHPPLHPTGLRQSPLVAVILTNGDIDHVAGLLSLREGSPFTLHATGTVLGTLAHDRVFGVLAPDRVRREAMELERTFEAAGLTVTAFAVPGKVALYLEGERPDPSALGEETVALDIRANGRRAIYAPACAALPDWLIERMEGADVILFDGTVYHDDDMIRAGCGSKTGRRMGHVPMTGPEGSLSRLATVGGRRIFIHINNTNPVLLPGPERDAIHAAGWEIATDGQEIVP